MLQSVLFTDLLGNFLLDGALTASYTRPRHPSITLNTRYPENGKGGRLLTGLYAVINCSWITGILKCFF